MTMSQLQLVLDNAVRASKEDPMGYKDELQPGPFTLVSVAKRYIRQNASDGVDCPCCGRLVKEYRRKLNSGMAATLVWMVGKYLGPEGGGWIDVQRDAPKRVLRSRELGKLRHWGLVHQETGKQASWAPTQRGVEFVTRKIRVQSHALIQDNVCNGFAGELISIDEALTEKFDYTELMEGRGFDEEG